MEQQPFKWPWDYNECNKCDADSLIHCASDHCQLIMLSSVAVFINGTPYCITCAAQKS